MTSRMKETRALAGVQPVGRDDACDTAHELNRLRVGGARPSTRWRLARGRPRRRVDELAEPQLEHHQLPEPVPVVGAAVAELGPEPRDLAVVEHAAVAEPAVEQRAVGHRRAGRGAIRRSALVPYAALEDLAWDLLVERLAQQILAAAVLDLQRDRHRRGEFEQLVI